MDDSVSELVGCLGLYSLCLLLLEYCRGLAAGDLDVVVVSDTGLVDGQQHPHWKFLPCLKPEFVLSFLTC